jgi:hypothetical protein
MPSVKELYKKLSDVSIDADSINLNTDTLESLVSTAQADIAEIKDKGILNGGTVQTDVTGGYLSGLRDGEGNIFGSDRNFPVEVVNNYPVPVSGTFWQEIQPISGTVTANTGLTQPLTDTQLRASSVAVTNTSSTGATPTTFTSVTYATISASNTSRKGLTIFNEGAGLLYVTLGTSTTTTTSYTVRLSAGDYYEVPFGYTGLVAGLFGSAGTARVTQVS